MSFLEGKKILFISPRFFGYEEQIAAKLRALKADVLFFDDRPSNSVFVKALIRIHKNFLRTRIRAHYNRIFNAIRNKKLDYFLLIKGESIPVDFINRVKAANPGCVFIMYQYDSVRNNKNAVACFPAFDKIFSFDQDDVQQFNILKFRPLFYIDEYKDLEEKPTEFDITFIGTAHSDRYFLIKEMQKSISHLNLSTLLFFYCPSKLVYYGRKLFQKNFRNVNKKEISFISLSKKEVVEIIAKSRIVIDVQHPGQTGLTMRTIEALGGKKKLITTNPAIINYDFYNTNNVLLVDRKNPVIDEAFLQTPYQEIDRNIYEKYSISSWLEELFKK